MDTGGAPASQALAAGEFAAIAFATVTTIRPLMDIGAPVKLVVPSPSFGVGYTGAILGWSKRPNAAQVFMNYLMSERGQTTWNGRGESASPRKGIPGSLDPESIKIDFPPMSSEAIDRLKTRWSGMLNAQ
jgi:iron(III) transport system substrate-binding protein